MSNYLVSIIMPVKNGSDYLGEALSGIRSQNVDTEIIVVDDASTDNTCQIAESFGCILLKHTTCKGPAFAKNTALKVAKGKYVMFHDHDDILNPNVLEKMLQELRKNEGLFAVMAQVQDFFSPELSKEERAKVILRTEPYFGLFSGAILMKKELFDVIGLFSENIQAGDIIEWSDKVEQHNILTKKLAFTSAKRRIHNTNFGRTNKGKEYKDYAAILRSKLKRVDAK